MGCPTKEEIQNAVQEMHPSTKEFIFAETAVKISNPLETIKFYTGVLGMRLLLSRDCEETRSSYYVFTYADESQIPKDEEKFDVWWITRPGNLEMAHAWDSVDHPTKYQCGKVKPNEFGHFGICVPDYQSAIERFKQLGCEIIDNPTDTSLCYILDPDGYRIEIYDCHWH